MGAYPLVRLLQIRVLRETAARSAVTLRREQLAGAEKNVMEARQLWASFKQRRPEREAALFADICGKMVDQQRMDRYHADRAALAARDLELEEATRQAEKVRDEAHEALDTALAALQLASRKLQKFKEHRSLWEKQEQRRVELAEEAEQEDNISPRAATLATGPLAD